MSLVFKCIINVNNNKYLININKDINNIRFCDIFGEILKIDSNISFETNTFEIFDSQLNQFLRIRSAQQLIEFNSIVRVLTKPQFKDNYFNNNINNNTNVNKTTQINTIANHFSYLTPNDINNNNNETSYSKRMKIDNNLNYGLMTSNAIIGYNNDNNYKQYLNTSLTNDNTFSYLPQTYYSRKPSVSPPIASNSYTNSCIEPSNQKQLISPSIASTASQKSETLSQSKPSYCPKVVDYSKGFVSQKKSLLNKKSEEISEDKKRQTINKLLVELSAEGIISKSDTMNEKYLCQLCDQWFHSIDSAFDHKKSGEHFLTKIGDNLKGVDKSLTIGTEKLNDIKVLLARKQQLNKIDSILKHKYVKHGIRLKDGIGVNAYVCLECKVSFRSLVEVWSHYIRVNKLIDDSVYCSTTFKPIIDIKHKKNVKSSQNESKTRENEFKRRKIERNLRQNERKIRESEPHLHLRQIEIKLQSKLDKKDNKS